MPKKEELTNDAARAGDELPQFKMIRVICITFRIRACEIADRRGKQETTRFKPESSLSSSSMVATLAQLAELVK